MSEFCLHNQEMMILSNQEQFRVERPNWKREEYLASASGVQKSG